MDCTKLAATQPTAVRNGVGEAHIEKPREIISDELLQSLMEMRLVVDGATEEEDIFSAITCSRVAACTAPRPTRHSGPPTDSLRLSGGVGGRARAARN